MGIGCWMESRSGRVGVAWLTVGLLGLAGCGDQQEQPDAAEGGPQLGPSEVVEVVGEVDPSSPLAGVELVRSADVGPSYPNARMGFSTPDAGSRFAEGEAVEVRFSLSGYELGVPTPEGDERGIARAPDGQHIHFIVNDRSYQAIYDASEPVVLEDLPAGTHVLRAFPGRDWHESVKTPGALAQRLIVVGEEPAAHPAPEEWGPTLIYSRPQGEYEGAMADSILVDYFIANVRLSDGGYRVRLTVNGERQFLMSEWAPHLLLGMPEGEHVLQLELVDGDGMIVQSPFHPIEREFRVVR
ncbi:MAG: hypothetical protein EA351_07405 [Gemmatimonadales bacterium]|nr:MAG: hypothetical protein EA351_07405 [Gemmatimonadales bacterium]